MRSVKCVNAIRPLVAGSIPVASGFLVSVGDASELRKLLEMRRAVNRTNRNTGRRSFLVAGIVKVVDVDCFQARHLGGDAE